MSDVQEQTSSREYKDARMNAVIGSDKIFKKTRSDKQRL